MNDIESMKVVKIELIWEMLYQKNAKFLEDTQEHGCQNFILW